MGFFMCKNDFNGRGMIWLFDLDNTLHNASHAIFPKISANMNAYLRGHVTNADGSVLSDIQANALRVEYWKRFGATLLGISRVLDRRAKDFLEAAHRFDDLSALVDAERGLQVLLRKLPGKKVLLTNSAYRYSQAILKQLKLHHCFSGHIAIERMRVFGRISPKPSARFFRKLFAMLKVRSDDCVLVDDNIHILKVAKTAGMQTVLVTRYLNTDHYSEHAYPRPPRKKQIARPVYVDMKIPSVRNLMHYVGRFR